MPALPRYLAEEDESLSARDFERFSALAKQKFGLDLRKGKEDLVSARLRKKMRELSLVSFSDYFKLVEADRSGETLIGLIDALATNHTSFFREPAHFDFLRSRALPELQGRGRFNVWSAACSSGEEPYSIALALLDALGAQAGRQARILATDISTKVLKLAAAGVYPAERIAALDPKLQRSYFLRGERQSEGLFKLRPEVREMVEFRRLNLVEPLPSLGLFSLIFCRNVMIYFDAATQETLVNRLAACLEPGGYLFVGHAESLTGIRHPLEYVQPAVYRNGNESRRRNGNAS
jgi:chemotaxis protein methyltransferase CheR